MSDSNVKFLRRQVRNVAQELAPTLITNELLVELEKKLAARLEDRLDKISAYIKTTLETIDARSKEVQSYVVRNSAIPATAPTDTVEPPKASE